MQIFGEELMQLLYGPFQLVRPQVDTKRPKNFFSFYFRRSNLRPTQPNWKKEENTWSIKMSHLFSMAHTILPFCFCVLRRRCKETKVTRLTIRVSSKKLAWWKNNTTLSGDIRKLSIQSSVKSTKKENRNADKQCVYVSHSSLTVCVPSIFP